MHFLFEINIKSGSTCKHYFIPSIRFLLTVHTISQSHLKKIDTFTDKFVKKWIGLPPYTALHLKPALDITSISTLYKTTMTQAYTRIRILGDETVNSALQVDRGKKLAPQKFHLRLCRKNVSTSQIRELWSSRNA